MSLCNPSHNVFAAAGPIVLIFNAVAEAKNLFLLNSLCDLKTFIRCILPEVSVITSESFGKLILSIPDGLTISYTKGIISPANEILTSEPIPHLFLMI